MLFRSFPTPNSHFRVPTSDFRLPTSDFPTPNSQFPIPNSQFPTPNSHFPLPTSDFPLPTSHFRLPTSDFPIPTSHTTNPVPFIVVEGEGRKIPGYGTEIPLRSDGRLSDIAPTILQILSIPQPKEMTGRSMFLPPGYVSAPLEPRTLTAAVLG